MGVSQHMQREAVPDASCPQILMPLALSIGKDQWVTVQSLLQHLFTPYSLN
jgi:hypothetical protein